MEGSDVLWGCSEEAGVLMAGSVVDLAYDPARQNYKEVLVMANLRFEDMVRIHGSV